MLRNSSLSWKWGKKREREKKTDIAVQDFNLGMKNSLTKHRSPASPPPPTHTHTHSPRLILKPLWSKNFKVLKASVSFSCHN